MKLNCLELSEPLLTEDKGRIPLTDLYIKLPKWNATLRTNIKHQKKHKKYIL